ncbi:MAG: SBBP repeat-containing protein [Pyrinomonadaceae bacterium]
MFALSAAPKSGRANGARALALLLSWLLLTSALPTVSSLGRTSQAASQRETDSITAQGDESTPTVSPSQATKPDEATQAQIAEAYGKLSLSFEANRGQTDEQVQFIARGGGYSLFLTSTEAVMVLTKADAQKKREQGASDKSSDALQATVRGSERMNEAVHGAKASKAVASESAVLRMKLEGANPAAQAEGVDELPGKSNYFIGNDPQKWRTGIPSYARVLYRGIYPGVDLIYYGREQQLEYDFVVAPGVDPSGIRLAFEGAQTIETDAKGDLVLRTGAGELRQHKPVVYQEVDGARREVPSRYVLKDRQRVGFEMGAYDSSKPLVIDPVLTYSTFLGGTGRESGFGIAVDSVGNAYVTGLTTSFNFPVVNPAQGDVLFSTNAFVSKLNRDGSALIYSTYLGGSDADIARAIAVDSRGSAYVTGFTFASDFPVVNAVQPANGGRDDAFLTKLSPRGSEIVYSTYLGGESFDGGFDVATDAAGNAYVTGFVYSHDLATVNPLQAEKRGDQAFKSTDGGGNWMVSDTGLDATRVNDVAIDPLNPSILYTASELGIHKTTDAGNSWHASNTGIIAEDETTDLAIDPAHPSTVYLGSFTGFYKSTDSGNSWSLKRGQPPFQTIIPAVAVDPRRTSTVYLSEFGVPLKSTDSGETWFNPNTNGETALFAATSFAINPVNSSIIYSGTGGSGVYKSTDGGANWFPVNNGLPDAFSFLSDIVINPSNPSVLYVSAPFSGGVARSTDAGNHWSVVNAGLPSSPTVNTLSIDPAHPSTVYAGTSAGLFKSTNGGTNWNANANGLTNKVINAIAIDPLNTANVYVVTHSGAEGFLTKLNPSGSTKIYSTYFGGNEDDFMQGIAVDGDGNPYLTGFTDSPNFPTMNPIQPALASTASFASDAFVTKLDASGMGLAYSTYLGGNGDDEGTDIALDADGNAYVTGFATFQDFGIPSTFPTTPGAFQTSFGGAIDAFVTKIDPAGSSLVYSTFLGGEAPDQAYGITVNSAGQAFVTGQTTSENFPLAGPTQSFMNGFRDAFVTRLNTAGSALFFSTYLGGTNFSFSQNDEEGRGIGLDADGNIYVAGSTNAFNFPRVNALQEVRGGPTDAFVAKFGPALSSVRISGQVRLSNGTGLGGVTVTLTDGSGFTPRTTTTLSNGRYVFANLPAGRNYTITPSKASYGFSPESRTVLNVRTNLTTQNFVAFLRTFDLFVYALDVEGNIVTGVKMTLTGTRTGTCTTGAGGFCKFAALPGGGNYRVTPSKAGATFDPPSQSFTNLSDDLSFGFIVQYSISGRVTGFNDIGIGGVRVNLSGFRTASTVTDSNGNYSFKDLPAGEFYTVEPSKPGVTFTPATRTIQRLRNNQTAVDFKAFVTITGKVRLAGTMTGLSGVTMSLGGSQTSTTTTNASGIYTFANLPAGGDYTVTPSKPGYTFSPPSRSFNHLVVSPVPANTIFNAMQQ